MKKLEEWTAERVKKKFGFQSFNPITWQCYEKAATALNDLQSKLDASEKKRRKLKRRVNEFEYSTRGPWSRHRLLDEMRWPSGNARYTEISRVLNQQQARIEELTQENHRISYGTDHYRYQMDAKDARIKELEATLGKHPYIDLEHITRENAAKDEEITSLKTLNDKLKTDNRTVLNENERLYQRLGEGDQKQARLESDLADANKEIERYKDALDAHGMGYTYDVDARLAQAERERDELRAELKQRCDQVDQLQQWLDECIVATRFGAPVYSELPEKIQYLRQCAEEAEEALNAEREHGLKMSLWLKESRERAEKEEQKVAKWIQHADDAAEVRDELKAEIQRLTGLVERLVNVVNDPSSAWSSGEVQQVLRDAKRVGE